MFRECFDVKTRLLLFLLFGFCSATACNYNVKVNQTLNNEGFHRNLTYKVQFVTEEDADDQSSYKNCKLAVDQLIPAGLFANPIELGDLQRIEKLNAVLKNPTNIELSAEHATSNNAVILANIQGDEVDLWLPIHARYHRPVSGGGTVPIEIDPPKVYILCPEKVETECENKPSIASLSCDGGTDKCEWEEVSRDMINGPVIWKVPVGDFDHYFAIGLGTAMAIVGGSMHAIRTLHQMAINDRMKRL